MISFQNAIYILFSKFFLSSFAVVDLWSFFLQLYRRNCLSADCRFHDVPFKTQITDALNN